MTTTKSDYSSNSFKSSRQMEVAYHRLPSEVAFFFDVGVDTLFGEPYKISPEGLTMDVARNYSMREALSGSMQRYLEFARMSGMTSSELEHSVPEQMLSTPEMPVEGVSAVKALRIANEQGMPIYTVTQENAAEVMPQLELDYGVKTEIWAAVSAGREVTVSQTNITHAGWTGCGYIIFDPNTGAGAYKISGGLNGGITLLGVIQSMLRYINLMLSIIADDAYAESMGGGYEHTVNLKKYYECLLGCLAILGISASTVAIMAVAASKLFKILRLPASRMIAFAGGAMLVVTFISNTAKGCHDNPDLVIECAGLSALD